MNWLYVFHLSFLDNPIYEQDDYRVQVLVALELSKTLERLDKDGLEQEEIEEAKELLEKEEEVEEGEEEQDKEDDEVRLQKYSIAYYNDY